MNIRLYDPADITAVVSLMHLNTPQYFAPEEEQDFKDYLTYKLDLYYIAEEGGHIIGCGGINRAADGKSAMLSWDIIHSESQGKGVGTALTKFRIETLRNLGISHIVVRTSQHTYEFYEKMGFRLKEVVKDYWAAGFDMCRMELASVTYYNKQI